MICVVPHGQTEEEEASREGVQTGLFPNCASASLCAIPPKCRKATPSVLRPLWPRTCRAPQGLFSPCSPSSGLELGQGLQVHQDLPPKARDQNRKQEAWLLVLADPVAPQPQSANSGFLLHLLTSSFGSVSGPCAASLPDMRAGACQELIPSVCPPRDRRGRSTLSPASREHTTAGSPPGRHRHRGPKPGPKRHPLSAGRRGHSMWSLQKVTHTLCSNDKQAKQPAAPVTPLSKSVLLSNFIPSSNY